MTTEPKTLKDIDTYMMLPNGSRMVSSTLLRAEAIKWIKDYKEKYERAFSGGELYLNDGWDAFKNFFNLTEEDLK